MEPSEMDSLIFSGRNQGTPMLEARPLEDLRVVLTALCDSGTHRCPPRQFPFPSASGNCSDHLLMRGMGSPGPPGLRICLCCELWCRSQKWLGSHMAAV